MKTIDEIFSDVTLIGETPNLIMATQMPDKIFDEVKGWIEPCRAIKDDEYGQLLFHHNVGTGHNSFQTPVPRQLVDTSYFLGYILHFAELYLRSTQTHELNNMIMPRRAHLRNFPGHYYGYDLWVNFAYQGDDNPEHNHGGSLSSIIYIQDEDKQPTYFPALDYYHESVPGQILLFPAFLRHSVSEKETESERLTASFNLDVY